MGLLYKPFAIIAKLISKKAGQKAFAAAWEKLGDGERPPAPNAAHRPLPSVFVTAAFEAAVLAGVGAVIDQLFGRVFHHLIGAWPGRPGELDEPADAEQQPQA